MTNMTSSSNNKPASSLTDFSIHSIIHGSPSRSVQRAASIVFNCPAPHDSQPSLDAQLPLIGDTPKSQRRQQQHQQASVRKYRPKNFQCPACKMAFSNNGQLKNHVRIHTGERPFQCDLDNCRKTFTRNEELTRHKLIHTGFRPHACGTCSKRFGRKDHLKKHLRTHERKKLRRRVSLGVTGKHQVVSIAGNTQHESSCYLDTLARTSANPINNTYKNNQQPNVRSLSCASVCSAQDISQLHSALMSTHRSASLLSNHLPSTTTTTTASLSLRNSTESSFQHKPFFMSCNSIQQLACDYWSKWYNIFGLYQHQPSQQPVVASARSVAPPTESSPESIFSKHI